MNTAEQILVIFLSVTLAIFLIVGIVIGIHIIRLLKKVESVADAAESISDNVRDTIEKLTALTTLRGILSVIKGKASHDKSPKKDDEE
jgi:heme/copper-type cytochrome/quinol oxidase subunit 2